MTRNTKEVALIQIRTGKLAQMPDALNQSEFGLANDANRLFIGNPSNPELFNRTTFPYKNLEILTEFTNLKDYYKYSYENNILKSGEVTNRVKLREYLPIVITCGEYNPPSSTATIKINTVPIEIPGNSTIYNTINLINAQYTTSRVYATILNGSLTRITFVSLTNELAVEDPSNILNFTQSDTYNISMPQRKIDEKLDDNLHITDFGIKGDGTIVSNEIFNCLAEVYRKYSDNQFYRDVYFPAGEYKFARENAIGPNNNVEVISSFPILSNMYVKGEGIDRTIIKTESFGGISLIETLNDNLIPSFANSTAFSQGGYPNNVVIENMTFDSSTSTILCNLVSTSNVTFNNVRFIGGGNSTSSLISIRGVDNNHKASDITFNNCIFENAKIGIDIVEYVRNVNINNCKFKNIKNRALQIGRNVNSERVYGVNVDTNVFEAVNGDYVIWLDRSAKYVSIHQSTFDKGVIERTANTKPYRDFEANDRKNFCDTLDITTDEKKLLKFHFAQPEWQYINYLVNPTDGKTEFTVEGRDLIDSANGIDISLDGNKVNATVAKDGDLSINLGNSSNIILGETNDGDMIWQPSHSYEEGDEIFHDGYVWVARDNFTSGLEFNEDNWIRGDELSQIILKRALQLNDNIISNAMGHNDIVIKPAQDKVIVVDDSENTDLEYEDLIVNKDKALTTVKYVKRMIQDSIIKHITYEDMVNYQPTANDQPMLHIHTFDKDHYGDNVHITNVVVNVRNPFYKLYENLNKAVNYLTGYRYYKGDVVKGSGTGGLKYAVVLKTHDAESEAIEGNPNLKVIGNNPNYKDIKYVDVVGSSNESMAYFTQTYSENFDYDPQLYTVSSPDIQTANRFGYDSVEELSLVRRYGTSNVVASYADINYVILESESEEGEDPTRTMTPEDLHDIELAERKYDEGFVYSYDEDRNLTIQNRRVELSSNGNIIQNPYSINYSDGSLYLKFYDEDYNEMIKYDVSEQGQVVQPKNLFDITQLNPAGDLIVRIDFLRQEV